MTVLSSCPSRDELNSCLAPIGGASVSVESHVAFCRHCQTTLENIAGDKAWWSDASTLLTLPEDPAAERIAHSVCALSGQEADAAEQDARHVHELSRLQDLLEPASHPELLGRIGRYEVEQLVGVGGMGLVFRGRDTELHRVVAIKTIASHLSPLGPARERFEREARACASLTHPHIVAVHDIVTEGPVPAIVMQYVAGPTLGEAITNGGPMHWKRVLSLGAQLCDALETAHQSGLIHRDIKPGNVLLEAGQSRAMLTDFGLVRALDDRTLTRTGTLAGTPDYMSPEQSWGHELDPRSDLFSLGSLLYTMLTGQPPFQATEPMATLNRLCNDRHRPLRDAVPDLPLEISQLVDRLLAKQPRKRFSSAGEVRDRIHELTQADLVLRSPRRRWQTIGLSAVAIAAAMVIVLVPAIDWWLLPNATGSLEVQMMPPNTSMPAVGNIAPSSIIGFPELQVTDDRAQTVLSETLRLEAEFARPSIAEVLSHCEDVVPDQAELGDIRQILQRLESEIGRQ